MQPIYRGDGTPERTGSLFFPIEAVAVQFVAVLLAQRRLVPL